MPGQHRHGFESRFHLAHKPCSFFVRFRSDEQYAAYVGLFMQCLDSAGVGGPLRQRLERLLWDLKRHVIPKEREEVRTSAAAVSWICALP